MSYIYLEEETEMNSIKLVIPQVPLSTNKRNSLSWTRYGQVQLQEIKKLWIDEIWIAFWQIEEEMNWPLKKAKRDDDNYPCKEVIDAIKNNGLIEDDSYEHIGKAMIGMQEGVILPEPPLDNKISSAIIIID